MSKRFLLGATRALRAAVVVLAAAPTASAAGRVLVQSGTGISPVSARIAQSLSPGWSSLWLSVKVVGGPGRFALVVPAPAGTAVDPSLDAWLEALDAATAPRVRPPKGLLACGATTPSSLENLTTAHTPALPPSSVAVLSSLSDLSVFAAKLGLDFSASDAASLAEHPAAAFIGVVYDSKNDAATTETLRFVLPSGAPDLGLSLLGPGEAPEVVLWTIGEGRARVSGAEEVESGDLGVSWAVMVGASNYLARRSQLLSEKQGGAWLLEASGSTPLFVWNVLPSGLGAIAPAVRAYIDTARAQGANVGDTETCLGSIADAREKSKQGARVARACAPGTLAVVPGGPASCDEKPGAGELSAAALRCGDADDLAYALSGLLASDAKLTRLSGLVGSKTPTSTQVLLEPTPSVSPLVTADEADTTGCFLGAGGNGGYGGGDPPPAGGGYGADDGVIVEQRPQTSVDVSCWGSSHSTSSGGDRCGGDSSSGSSDGDTCSGDGSGSSSDEGDTCSGDSSSSSSEGDTCSGDSGSADGDTCGGSSSSGGGDSCGGGSSGSGNCSVGRSRPRVRVSAVSLLLAALALVTRRRTRRGRSSSAAP
jgi:hypothetical protein